LALDEPKDTDDVFDMDGYKFIVDKELMIKAQPITVDLSYMGFQVTSNLELGGGGCGSSCSTGSCGH
jgi:Fe-S cluster assembly iron-binding protein IscA